MARTAAGLDRKRGDGIPAVRRAPLSRRSFLACSAAAGCSAACNRFEREPPSRGVPRFLAGYEDLYRQDPRRAAARWFSGARLGLGLRYGVYSQLGRGDLVQWEERIPPAEYEKLQETFNPEGFDADRLAGVAAEAGASYVNLCCRHYDGFCLFRTNETGFTSVGFPARRDLLGELTGACDRQGLGLFVDFAYAAGWRHPYFYPRETAQADWPYARPPYEQKPARYRFSRDEDFLRYLKTVHWQLEEILYRYKPLAGICLTPAMGYWARPDLFLLDQAYGIVREAQPGALLSFGLGVNGGEDLAVEGRWSELERNAGQRARRAHEANAGKPSERRAPFVPGAWGYREDAADRLTAAEAASLSKQARAEGQNLLLVSALLPDGSMHPGEERALREAGRKLSES